MPVVMKGGTSGCKHDYLANTPDSGHPQPVQTTETSAPLPSNINFDGAFSGCREDFAAKMPTGGGNGTGTDIEDPNA